MPLSSKACKMSSNPHLAFSHPHIILFSILNFRCIKETAKLLCSRAFQILLPGIGSVWLKSMLIKILHRFGHFLQQHCPCLFCPGLKLFLVRANLALLCYDKPFAKSKILEKIPFMAFYLSDTHSVFYIIIFRLAVFNSHDHPSQYKTDST